MTTGADFRLEILPPGPDGDADWAAVHRAAAGPPPDEPAPEPARRLVAYRGGEPVARLAFAARSGFTGAGGLTGYVGWYGATEAAAGAAALRHAASLLFAEGAERVVGPLNGSTWHRYRLALPRDGEIEDGGPFLSEPRNPPGYPDHFEAAGFRPHLEYETRLVRRPAADGSLAAARARLAEAGVGIRSLDPERFAEELPGLYGLSVLAFAENPYYTPIPFEAFGALYAPLRPLLDPALVRLAEDGEGRLLGYVFAFPDLLAAPGSPRIVLKTLAAHPAARGLGLGRVLVDEVHRAAAARGASVLHALMHLSNASRGISGRSESEPFRRYRLYAAARP
jgi:GNAT superfamily N-acetyltransferase